jgi:hypothetical protein
LLAQSLQYDSSPAHNRRSSFSTANTDAMHNNTYDPFEQSVQIDSDDGDDEQQQQQQQHQPTNSNRYLSQDQLYSLLDTMQVDSAFVQQYEAEYGEVITRCWYTSTLN